MKLSFFVAPELY
jgi:hypothetical protein